MEDYQILKQNLSIKIHKTNFMQKDILFQNKSGKLKNK